MEEPLRERLADWVAGLGRRQLAALAVVGVVTLAGAGFWYVRALPRPVTVTAEAAPTAAAGPEATPATVLVHVAGWVQKPGVYELPLGARIVDALEVAGGAREGADLTALNLAAVLTDAQQVLVAKKGAAPPAGGPGVAGGGPDAGELVNLNTATLEQLESLPGIGPVLAQKIIDYREENGAFTRIEDLMNVSGIGEARFAELKDEVTV